jgi:two-component system cell cycle sensor histidine kinase/response regulator CckA
MPESEVIHRPHASAWIAPDPYTRTAQIGGLCVAAIGGAALVGWATGSRVLKAGGSGFIPVAPNTAILFVLLGVGLAMAAVSLRPARVFVRLAIAVSFIAAGARLVEYFAGADLGVDQWMFAVPSESVGLAPVGKMAFFTALSFVFASLALLPQALAPRRLPSRARYVDDLARAAGLLVTLVGLVFSLGYVYHAPLLYGGRSIPMALPTAVGFLVLGLAVTVPAILRDQADRREQERSRAHIDGAFEHAAVGIALVSPDGRWVRVNRALCGIVGYTEQELLATTFQAVTHPDDLEADLTATRQMLAAEIPTYEKEKRYLHKQGHVVWILLTASLARDAAGRPLHFITQIQDITERKRAEAAHTRQALVFDTISDGVIVMDVEGSVTDWNPAAERIFGYTRDEMLGRDIAHIHQPRLGGRVEREIRAGLARDGRWSGELPFLRKDGAEGVADVVVVVQRDARGSPTAWIGVNRDVTERKRTEEALRKSEDQLRQSQRLEAVGQLAGGVAHDFNNLLTVIKAHAEFALEDLGAGHPQSVDVQTIRGAADRAAALTRQLLAFSRRQVLEPRVLDLNELVTQFEKMVRRVMPADIGIVTKLAADLTTVEADPGQLEQVLMNLVVNARDAMPEGGTITVETANVELDRTYAARHAPVEIVPGPYVALIVSDTGTGMDQVTQARIFEPFFTTKERGHGTGLGLSTVYGIVKQSGGYVWVYSEPGQGASFRVYLPRASSVAAEAPPTGEPVAVRRGVETILLVEDDALVRGVARRVLAKNGYHVLEAANGADAMHVSAEAEGRIDLILSDLVMPEMGGRELAAQLHVRHPGARVLFMSGYTEDAALRRNVLEPGEAFLPKPFTPDALARKVREVLDTAAPAAVPSLPMPGSGAPTRR